VGQDSQFHLGIIGGQQDRIIIESEIRSMIGDERPPDSTTDIRSDRNILEVRID
jgi:hypothetical protein